MASPSSVFVSVDAENLADGWVLTGASASAVPSLGLHTEVVLGRDTLNLAAAKIPAVVSVVAPKQVDSVRAPVRLIAVLDKSGSMQGEKLELVKKTMQLMLRHLSEKDAVGLVQYDSTVKVLAPLTACCSEGRAKLESRIQGLRAGTQTNLSGGVLQGLQLHKEGFRSAGNTEAGDLQRVQFGNTYRQLSEEEQHARAAEHFGSGSAPPGAVRKHEWTLELRFASLEEAALVQRVVYTLHHTFAQPVVEVDEGPLFKLTRFGWGTFEVKASIHLHDGRVLALGHDLVFGRAETFHTHLLPLRAPLMPQLNSGQVDETGVLRSTFLFTDGLANQGITAHDQICTAVQRMLDELGANRCALSTFGFGKDHSAELLGEIAQVGQGSYNYIESEDQIGEAFGEAIGGLLTTTHQNVRLQLQMDPAVHLRRVWTDYPIAAQTTSVLTVDVGDLYAEERRDILVELEVPAADHEGVTILGEAKAEGFSVLAMRSEEVCTGDLSIQRCSGAPDEVTISVPHVERQRCRFITADALKAARLEANRGNLDAARALLRTACEALSASSLSVQGDVVVLGLIADVNECLNEMRHHESYSQYGSKKMMNLTMTHYRQRGMNTISGDQYSNGATMTMKSRFKAGIS